MSHPTKAVSRDRRRAGLPGLLFLSGLLVLAPPARGETPDVVVSHEVVPMRDGVRLAIDVYRPARSGVPLEGRFPAILERTPYGKETVAGWAGRLVARGYVVLGQDVRGRYASEGRWRLHEDDGRDGYDTAEWIGRQDWSDGGFGTVGTSYPGGTQHALALTNPRYLKAMVPVDAMSDYGRFGIRNSGAFELRWLNWIMNLGFWKPPAPLPNVDAASWDALFTLRDHVREYARGLPLRRGATPLRLAPDYEAWLVEALGHGDDDEFWRNRGASVIDHVAEYKDIPVYHVGGWYDSWAAQTANLNYGHLARAKASPQRLIMGPWTHGGQWTSYAGEAEFGPEAAIDLTALETRWFDRWLRGQDNGADREPPVRIFVMGGGDAQRTPEGRVFVGGRWRDEQEWPLARTRLTPYYLHGGGSLSPALPPEAPPTRYIFDPRHPVPTLGGNVSSEGNLMFRGAADQRCRAEFWACEDTRPLSARSDVLVFETEPLKEDVEITGSLVVTLFASSSAVDTDFTAKLVDVYPPNSSFPAGVGLNVADGILRARYRDSLSAPSLLRPEEVYAFNIEMYPTSLVFKRGHRLRLDISSSNFPRFDVNPNTGEPLNDNHRWALAENAVFHDPKHPSHILLPVIPGP